MASSAAVSISWRASWGVRGAVIGALALAGCVFQGSVLGRFFRRGLLLFLDGH